MCSCRTLPKTASFRFRPLFLRRYSPVLSAQAAPSGSGSLPEVFRSLSFLQRVWYDLVDQRDHRSHLLCTSGSTDTPAGMKHRISLRSLHKDIPDSMWSATMSMRSCNVVLRPFFLVMFTLPPGEAFNSWLLYSLIQRWSWPCDGISKTLHVSKIDPFPVK